MTEKPSYISLSYRNIKPDWTVVPESGEFVELNRNFRKNPTKAEKILWEYLRNRNLNGYKFYRQHPIAGHSVDFYCKQKRLAIEIDGSIHNLPHKKEHDIIRQETLEEYGLTFIRFRNREVFNNTNTVLEKILCCLNNGTSTPESPSPHQEKGTPKSSSERS